MTYYTITYLYSLVSGLPSRIARVLSAPLEASPAPLSDGRRIRFRERPMFIRGDRHYQNPHRQALTAGQLKEVYLPENRQTDDMLDSNDTPQVEDNLQNIANTLKWVEEEFDVVPDFKPVVIPPAPANWTVSILLHINCKQLYSLRLCIKYPKLTV